MARFRLTAPHYLNVPGTEWEQNETLPTGKIYRHRYKVHMYLDPKDPGDHNYPLTGEIIVATVADPRYPLDLIFLGEPTQDMEPLDAEAEALFQAAMSRPQPMTEDDLRRAMATPRTESEEMKQMREMMKAMQEQVTAVIGQNEKLKQRLEEVEEAEPIPPASPNQPSLRL